MVQTFSSLCGSLHPSLQMGDQDSSSSASQTEEEEDQDEGPTEEEEEEEEEERRKLSLSSFSSSLRAVVRIKQKYQALKRRRQEMEAAVASLGGAGPQQGAPLRTSPKIFTFDPAGSQQAPPPNPAQRRKRKRRKRVLFPNRRRRRVPPRQERNHAQNVLYLLLAIVCMQVYNAIENLDDHVLSYDLEGLEKTLRREVFGQQGAMESLVSTLRDYLSTYGHRGPLVLSVVGGAGVGKSHLGRLLASHFRCVVGEPLVLQYYVLHRCPLEAEAQRCGQQLSANMAAAARQAEEEEKIPLFVVDEAEHAPAALLDALLPLATPRRSAEPPLNAIFLFLSSLGHTHITKHLLHNASSLDSAPTPTARHAHLLAALEPTLRRTLEEHHPLWSEARLLPLGLLERRHVTQCFLDEMQREGFYPDAPHGQRLAAQLDYYPEVGGRSYARTGCKQVVATVNTL